MDYLVNGKECISTAPGYRRVIVYLDRNDGFYLIFWNGAIPRLPFDHNEIVGKAMRRFHDKSTYSSLPAFLLPAEFTLNELWELYERITGGPIDRANLRRQIVDVQKLIVPTGGSRRGLAHRPAQLFRLSDSALRNFGKAVFQVGKA